MNAVKIIKTETVAEFLARGGKITKCAPKRLYVKKDKPEQKQTVEVNWNHIPEFIKIRLGNNFNDK